MKIIDEKGRLFGKINVIDFLAILFIIGLVPMFYFGYNIFTARPKIAKITESKKESRFGVVMLCKLIKLEAEVAKIISVGDKEHNLEGETIGEIISIDEIAPYNLELDIGAGEKIIKEETNFKIAVARVRLNIALKNNALYYKDKLFSIGSLLEFKTDKYTVTMIPISESEYFADKELDLYIVLKDVDNNLLPLITAGDKEVEPNGQMIAEILSVGKVENNSFAFNLGSNAFLRAEDASKKQVTVKMRLKCQIGHNEQVYFKGKKIAYTMPIELNTEEYSLKGIVTQTFEMPLHVLKETWVSIQVKFTGVIPEITKLVKIGDVSRNVEGDIYAKLTKIISDKESAMLNIERGRFVSLRHPFYRDILVWIDILSIDKERNYYFNNSLIKIGNTFNFTTDLYNISGIITGLEVK